MGGIFDILVSPFKTAFNFIKSIPFVGKLLGGDAATTYKQRSTANVEKQVTMAVEVKNLDELKETVDKLTDAISKLGGTAGGATPIVNVNNNQNAMIEKLDELIGLLKNGAIAVNMDGILVSRTLAKSS
jgi:molybdopterin converting factor small subunit